LRLEDGGSQCRASLIHSGIHHRGTEDTEGMYFFVYRDLPAIALAKSWQAGIPIDENSL